MKITRLSIHRFLGIADLDVPLDPGVNMVRGKNGSGKSSVLKAIMKAFRGGKADAPWVIHQIRNSDNGIERMSGYKESETDEIPPNVARILVELDGGLTIQRTIAPGGTDLTVMRKDGKAELAVRSPQKFLDDLVGASTLNPVEFFKASAADRKRILLSVVPALLKPEDVHGILNDYGVPPMEEVDGYGTIGLDEIGEIEHALMEVRRAAWSAKEHAEEAAKAETAKLPPGYKPEDVPDSASVLSELDKAHATVKAANEARHVMQTMLAARDRARDEVKRIEQEMEYLKIKLGSAVTTAEQSERILVEAQSSLNDAVRRAVDPEPINAKFLALETRRANRKAYDESTSHEEAQKVQAELVRSYDAAMRNGLRVEAPRLLWSRLAETPLAGLDIGMEGDRITVGGVDIDNLSQKEQIVLAYNVAKATAPDVGGLRVILMDGFEALDQAARAAFREGADPTFQHIIAEVSDGPLEVGT